MSLTDEQQQQQLDEFHVAPYLGGIVEVAEPQHHLRAELGDVGPLHRRRRVAGRAAPREEREAPGSFA